MDITIHEKHTKVEQHIKDLAHEKLEKITRFVHDASRVEVDFIEQPVKKHRNVSYAKLPFSARRIS